MEEEESRTQPEERVVLVRGMFHELTAPPWSVATLLLLAAKDWRYEGHSVRSAEGPRTPHPLSCLQGDVRPPQAHTVPL